MPNRGTCLHWRLDSIRNEGRSAAGRAKKTWIVLLHGNSMAGSIFARQFEGTLSKHYRLAAPDLLGHGRSHRSDQPDLDYTPSGHASVIRRDLDRLGIASALLVGHSYGGHVALALAAQLPTVTGLVLTGMVPVRPGPDDLAGMFNPLPSLNLLAKECFSEHDAAIWAGACLQGSPHPVPDFLADDVRSADGRHRRVLMENVSAGTLMDEVEFLRKSTMPIRFVVGESEGVVNVGKLEGRLRDLGLEQAVSIPRAGHAPFWDNAAAFDRELSAFADFVTTRLERSLAPLPGPECPE
ncbi:alpha/beta fold hydrolase [Azospirillum isscasi]|uniref:Alpha/beta hydrolase n=1 Tax=Azospirillum isscasi TaxID=3053926 RepID=A0ABU0WQA8_9PROT|nr:alpha/beta hydrolase [Azospirillum isscasi]MDQ2106428.1 alpha/beta hydrolase [Azospirillum isscasi]